MMEFATVAISLHQPSNATGGVEWIFAPVAMDGLECPYAGRAKSLPGYALTHD